MTDQTPKRPRLATLIAALRVRPTEEDLDVAGALEATEANHRPTSATETDGHWGTCTACAVPWPCPVWIEAEQDGLLFLGRAQDRVAAHARQTLDRLAARDRERRTA